MAFAYIHAHRTGKSKNIFARILDGMIWIGENNRRVQQAQALHAMSDEQLAERGLRREDIARHVFRDIMFA
ncbi:DUF1127 domain-containing protein [Roseivivax sp. THAF30]|uniref:DUF1127 domain-containing protein n=1 Tax=Roseivivax sp. THAF30 TaxID=2587852 RepID=UPI00126945A9|nr:DUF1127 domain-containing protein [Roseivivax sp. THAF30]QFT61753.1 hypothetical protein FIU91_02330 [Roseivivax sp. THAF30]